MFCSNSTLCLVLGNRPQFHSSFISSLAKELFTFPQTSFLHPPYSMIITMHPLLILMKLNIFVSLHHILTTFHLRVKTTPPHPTVYSPVLPQFTGDYTTVVSVTFKTFLQSTRKQLTIKESFAAPAVCLFTVPDHYQLIILVD